MSHQAVCSCYALLGYERFNALLGYERFNDRYQFTFNCWKLNTMFETVIGLMLSIKYDT
jgi:hypothetical protein